MAEFKSGQVTDNILDTLKSIEPERAWKEKSSKVPAGSDFKVNFSGESLLNGIIMAEVLGKPRCLRSGRR
jgi:hypothetical protein